MSEESLNSVDQEVAEAILPESQLVEEVDYSQYNSLEFSKLVDKLLKEGTLSDQYYTFKKIRPFVESLFEAEKNQALEKFVADGSSPDDFEFKADPFYEKFESASKKSKITFQQQAKENQHKKDDNYKHKSELLNQMRLLAEGTAGKNSFEKFKALQLDWKNTGQVPSERANELWSSYHAVCNRFYDNRSIAIELLELDRKRNLQGKQLICEKVEKLVNEQSIRKALKELDELHEEFKHIGPVPKENQEEVWNRLKAASDKIHEKRVEFLDDQKVKNQANLVKKLDILQKLSSYATFQSETPIEWAEKSKEIELLQKEWQSAGLVEKDKAKETNRQYWDTLKVFFNNKRQFFKDLEAVKLENLKLKTALCEKVDALVAAGDFEKGTDAILTLQKEWKAIGFVPLKNKDKIYNRFKKSCDAFFDGKRGIFKEQMEVAKLQLKGKIEFVTAFEKTDAKSFKSLADIQKSIDEWNTLPESAGPEYGKVFSQFAEAVKSKLVNVADADDLAKDKLVSKLQKAALAFHPDGEKEIQFRERKLRKDIRDIEDTMAQYKNNMEFFARAKNADAIRKEFTDKIVQEEVKLKLLKSRLAILLAN